MDSIAKETNVQKRAALAQAAFGSSGQALIDMAGDLAAKRKEAQAQGPSSRTRTWPPGAALHASLIKVKAAFTGITNTVFGKIAASIGPVVEKFNGWILANKDIIGQKIDTVFKAIGNVFAKLGPSILRIIERSCRRSSSSSTARSPSSWRCWTSSSTYWTRCWISSDPILDIFVALSPRSKPWRRC